MAQSRRVVGVGWVIDAGGVHDGIRRAGVMPGSEGLQRIMHSSHGVCRVVLRGIPGEVVLGVQQHLSISFPGVEVAPGHRVPSAQR